MFEHKKQLLHEVKVERPNLQYIHENENYFLFIPFKNIFYKKMKKYF